MLSCGAVTENRYHHGDLPAALLAAVRELVAEVGASAVSLRQVSQRAGVSVAAPSHHFGDKRGLLTAFAIEGLEQLGDSLARASATAGSEPRDRIRAIARGYVSFAIEHPEHFAVVFRPELYDEEDPGLRAVGDRNFGLLADAVEEAQRTGWCTSQDSLELAVATWAAIHGMATLWVEGLVDQRIRAGGPTSLITTVLAALGLSARSSDGS